VASRLFSKSVPMQTSPVSKDSTPAWRKASMLVASNCTTCGSSPLSACTRSWFESMANTVQPFSTRVVATAVPKRPKPMTTNSDSRAPLLKGEYWAGPAAFRSSSTLRAGAVDRAANGYRERMRRPRFRRICIERSQTVAADVSGAENWPDDRTRVCSRVRVFVAIVYPSPVQAGIQPVLPACGSERIIA